MTWFTGQNWEKYILPPITKKTGFAHRARLLKTAKCTCFIKPMATVLKMEYATPFQATAFILKEILPILFFIPRVAGTVAEPLMLKWWNLITDTFFISPRGTPLIKYR